MPARILAAVVFALASVAAADCPSAVDVDAARARAKAANTLEAQQKADALEAVRAECLAEEKLAAREGDSAEQRRQRDEEETAKQAKEALAKDEFRAAVVALAADPAGFQILASVKICDEKAEEKKLLAAIQEEKANSKIAGVVSLSALKDLQDEVVYSRKLQTRYREGIAGLKLKVLSCSDKSTRKLMQCRSSRECSPDAVAALEVIDLRNR